MRRSRLRAPARPAAASPSSRAEVRKLAERSIKSTESIKQIIGGVQNEANATIMATEQGARQAREVGELMGTTASMLEQSILATQQQQSAADQVAEAMIQIREAAGQLAADQTQREDTSERVELLVGELDSTLARFGVARTDRAASGARHERRPRPGAHRCRALRAAVTHVLEIGEIGALTAAPGASRATLGVRNLRGDVLPVFDLATALGLPRGDAPRRMLVAERRGALAGFAVDEVTDVGTLPEAEQEADSALLSSAALIDGTLVGVIDVDRPLRRPRERRMSQPEAEFLGIFRDEANERLDSMSAALLAIEDGSASADAIDSLFRDAHTIKGGAGMLGLDEIGVLAHAVEDVLAEAREHGMLPPGLADPLLRACDACARSSTATSRRPRGDRRPAGRARGRGRAQRRPGAAVAPAARPEPERDGHRPLPCASCRSRPQSAATRAPRPRQRVREPCACRPRSSTCCSTSSARRSSTASGSVTWSPRATRAQRELLADELDVGDRLLGALQDAAIQTRTLPFGSITGAFPRALRDIANAEGKDVDLVLEGTETELDRVILEGLSEPSSTCCATPSRMASKRLPSGSRPARPHAGAWC